jgi:hypothetical protein
MYVIMYVQKGIFGKVITSEFFLLATAINVCMMMGKNEQKGREK